MFKALKAGGEILSMSRLPLRVHSQVRQGPVRIQRVRFRRQVFRPKALISGILTFTVCYGVFTSIVLSPLDKVAEDLEKSLDEETKKELEAHNEPLFIPFPFTTKLVHPPPYQATDPEWQEYLRFSKNPALGRRARADLAEFIRNVAETNPFITLRCGKNKFRVKRYWLDVDFPLSPFPEFERSGIEIGDNYVAWATMPVDSLTVFRIRQALWPSALTRSLWTFSKVLFIQDSTKIADMLGMPTKPQPSLEALIRNHANRPAAGLPNSEALPKDAQTNATPHKLDESKHTDTSGVVATTSSNPLNPLAKSSAKPDVQLPTSPQDPNSLKTHLAYAFMAARAKFAQTWRAAPSYPPRGSIFVSGFVELVAPNAVVVMDVKAAWDPKTRTYDQRSMHLGIRRLTIMKQKPLPQP